MASRRSLLTTLAALTGLTGLALPLAPAGAVEAPRPTATTSAPAPTATTSAPGVAAAATSYVALGDSYSSGVGTRAYLDDGSTCQRSAYAFPSLVAAARGHALNFRACSGATVADVTASQLSALTTGTGLVTISVGGNDAGFADVLTECALPGWASDCNAAVDGAQAFIATTLPSSLRTLYGRIRTKAPSAKVVVVGYPRVFMGEDCNAATFFSPAEETRLNATADQLNGRLAAAASAAGFSFADPTSAFTGHAVCDDVEWLNGFSNPISESYHPNRAGQASGYTPLVGARTGSTLQVTAATLRTARANAPAQAALQRRYAELDARIEPEPFGAPDLDALRRTR